jgi:hypothetical protein
VKYFTGRKKEMNHIRVIRQVAYNVPQWIKGMNTIIIVDSPNVPTNQGKAKR